MKSLALVLLLLMVSVSTAALACPYCAANDVDSKTRVLWAVVPMILSPFAVVGVAWTVIRRLNRA
ncbi:MAG: hypothetical protein ACT4TC_13465 [Myxococcaceae bacterium]